MNGVKSFLHSYYWCQIYYHKSLTVLFQYFCTISALLSINVVKEEDVEGADENSFVNAAFHDSLRDNAPVATSYGGSVGGQSFNSSNEFPYSMVRCVLLNGVT